MDIEKIRTKKRQLELEIQKKIMEFEEETSARLYSVDLEYVNCGMMRDPDNQVLRHVKIEIVL